MKQIFEIETANGMSEQELLGCLEDTLGYNFAWSVKKIEERSK